MKAERTTCVKCGVSILVSTAQAYRGRCAPCWKKRFSARLKDACFGVLGLIGFFIALPFVAIRAGLRRMNRNAQFPYSRAALLEQILRVHSDPQVARRYRDGVVDGYCEPQSVMMTGNPSNLPYCRGIEDGSALRNGGLEFSAIPTCLSALTITGSIKSGVRV